MKNKFYLFVGLILLAGCSADPALGPIITVETAEVGAFPRTVELKVGEYDLMDLAGSSYLHDIDFRSIDGGNNVANYIINVSFDDNNSSNGDDSTTPIEFKNFTNNVTNIFSKPYYLYFYCKHNINFIKEYFCD